MGFLTRLLGGRQAAIEAAEPEVPKVVDLNIPGTLDLGWYWSDTKDQFQMAKVADADRATHCYVIGASGSGKTKFLEFLIQQDIEKGNGFGVIDPHGDLVEEIKGILACRYMTFDDEEEVRERVVLVDPTDRASTVTFNPLEKLPSVSVPEQVAELISSFRKIWADSWGVRMEDLMRSALIALGEAELTLLELPAFLTNRPFRRSVLERVSHPIVLEYFRTRFDTLTDRGQVAWIEPVMNKINAFLADHRIREMFASEKSSFNLREVMDEGKILLVKLDKGKLKDSSDLLGSLIMAKIMMAAFSRSDVPPSRRRPFYLYIDEFQNFASDSFSTVLSEARKYGLSLVMAHQTLAQINEELRSLILGNAGIQVCFRLNRHDAATLAKEAFQYSGFEVKSVHGSRPTYWSFAEEWEHKTEDIRDLPPRTCFVKHKIQGGLVELRTVQMVPATDVLDMTETEYHDFLTTVPFGSAYLRPRDELIRISRERAARLLPTPEPIASRVASVKPRREAEPTRRGAEVSEAASSPEREQVVTPDIALAGAELRADEAGPKLVISEPDAESLVAESTAARPRARKPTKVPVAERAQGKGGHQHKYLQALIKRMAEERGFKATIEASTPGAGPVDVGLERGGHRIACEISLTTGASHEFANVEKCLEAGYHEVIVCSPEKRTLAKLERYVAENLPEAKRDVVRFMAPEDILFHLDRHVAKTAARDTRVKGYRVKVKYEPVASDEERAAKREAVAQVILGSFRKMKSNQP